MRSTEPPKIARWILTHFGCSPNNAAVIGDLDERYRNGRSYAWYWKQVMTTLAIAFSQEVRARKLLALRAIVTGWILMLAGMFSFRALVITINSIMRWDSVWNGYRFSRLVHQLEITYPIVLLAPFELFSFVISCLGWASIGWALKRLYQPHEKTMVLAFIVTVFAAMAVFMSIALHSFPPFIALLILEGFGGNMIGIVALLLGAGLLRSDAHPEQLQGR
jgi:hypothetical protein